MDTRNKIVTAERALAIARDLHQNALRENAVPLQIVTGYFDVLQPDLVKRLEQHASAGSRLFAVVLDPAEALLATQARAELAASLRVIDYVIPFAGGPAEWIDKWIEEIQPVRWIREETAHEESTERLIEHVFERHSLERARRPGY